MGSAKDTQRRASPFPTRLQSWLQAGSFLYSLLRTIKVFVGRSVIFRLASKPFPERAVLHFVTVPTTSKTSEGIRFGFCSGSSLGRFGNGLTCESKLQSKPPIQSNQGSDEKLMAKQLLLFTSPRKVSSSAILRVPNGPDFLVHVWSL